MLKLNGFLVPSVVVLAEFASAAPGEGVSPNENFGGSGSLVSNGLCPPVPEMLPDPVANANSFGGASDVAVLGDGILVPNPENPATPEGDPLLVPGLVLGKLKRSFFTSPGACEAPGNPKVNLGAAVVADELAVASGAAAGVLKENMAGFATSGVAVGARDDVGKIGGAAGLF